MPSSRHYGDTSYIPLGERRGKSDLARFSLDLTWARVVSENAHARAYPSPPMSGSPPLPPRHNPESVERLHGNYEPARQEGFRGTQAPYGEPSRGPPLQAYSSDPVSSGLPARPYAPYRPEDMTSVQLQYQPQLPYIATHEQHRSYHHLPPAPIPTADRAPLRDATEYASPKAQRKTKGHVASACVPCKRAHLRCDAQRPCSRCLSNGKEAACVDVAHKKRGRPRLRDERELRHEGTASTFHPPEPPIRRPLSLYNSEEAGMPFGDTLQRGSYRVLKSHSGTSGSRLSAHMVGHETSTFAASMPPTPRTTSTQEMTCAYLTMDMQLVKATQSFGEMLGSQHVAARKLQDIVAISDREKAMRLQRAFEDERREREPHYLPPIYPKHEEDRIIQSAGFSSEEIGQIRTDRQEIFTFQSPDGQQRTFHVRLGLLKKESTYFIIMTLHVPATPQNFRPSPSPYSRDSRDSQYGLSTPQHYSSSPGPSSFMTTPMYGAPRAETRHFQPPGPVPQMGTNIPPSTLPPSFALAPAPTRREHPSHPFQTPSSEMAPQPQTQRPHDLQLPPIRDRAPASRRDDRSGRVDIGGLLENPDPRQRGGN